MNQQTKAKLMDLFSEALDKNAYVNIHFPHYETDDFKPVFKNDVEEKAKELAEMLSVNAEETIRDSFVIRKDSIRLCFTYVPLENVNGYMEEDVFQEEDAI